MKTILCLIFIVGGAMVLLAEPNEPNEPVLVIDLNYIYEVESLRPINPLEMDAMRINGATLQRVVDIALRNEIRRAKRVTVEKAFEQMIEKMTLTEIEARVKELEKGR